MKTPNMTTRKLTLFLTLLCALSASALNVLAQNKYVNTSGTTFDSDNTYTSISGYAALEVSSNGLASPAVYSGTAITLNTVAGNSGASAVRAADGGVAYLFSSTLLVPDSTAGRLGGVGNSGTLYVYNSIGQSNSNGVDVVGVGSKLIADNFEITIFAQALAINVYTNGAAEIYNSRLITTADGGVVLGTASGGTLVGDNLQLIATGAGDTVGFRGSGASLTLTNSEITARTGIIVRDFTDGVRLENTIINATDTGLNLLGNAPFTIIGGAINSAGGNALLTSSPVRQDIHISAHADIQGDITNVASGTLSVTLNASTLTGDANNLGDGTLIINLNNNATGTGGYNGGNLIVGGDSTWDFTKDSVLNHLDNHGIIHLGAHGNYLAIHSDSISGDSTWYFPVDSDTGAKSTVTGSTAATSHPRGIISATGDGLRDPNTVANTLVTGENKANWIWDNFSWGLEEYTQDGHDPAGNPHFTQRGTSPAGAVLNSAIAVQQSLWFAQQDSLLKRMGELRYGARASRPQADKDVRVPYNSLIENLWLRSYGQQLNIGSQVSGKAYEQLTYGVDIGTDHKFTLSTDSDLYLGVYAGYGRSDLNYRTPGADGEINSYYGGLYATWLHSSGFYIDATFKAASVDNDLKAPYSGSQITAKYSDVNLGGSLEIGKKFTFADAWFIEPQFQVNYLHILAEDYTAGHMTLKAQDLDALQLRLGTLFGRTINLTNSGALQPYIKISGVETISTGGTIHNGYQSTRANTDGARAEVGGGIIWQLNANNQLHLDYEASFGDKYDKPWGLTAGYRHQF
ncbi:MAG: autotransporter outer membrane beta-barrel domain-containing protein [Verrucomicrobiales bacterium]|jgi:outer membrane autotransporter protein|nr:autotransporter outer membrane beta-barrel domain-containing protein [Verrucomicrobiales bacterium]